jgi:hypothetical protein
MAAVRRIWMFRTAAILFLFFGATCLWRFGFTDYHPEQRPFGLLGGALAVLLGVFLFRGQRFAIGASAIAAAFVGVAAAVFAPITKGPVILFLAAMAAGCILYAVMCFRTLTDPTPPRQN